MARFLLDRGASATRADTAGYTPLHGAALAVVWAMRSDDKGGSGVYRRAPALLSLNHAGSKASPFSPEEALEVVQRLLEGGADPNRQTVYPTPGPVGDVRINPAPPGSSALHIAANSGSVKLVKLLTDCGADPNLLRKDGHTPLSVAVVAGDLPVVKELVERGAEVSARNDPDDKIPARSRQSRCRGRARPSRTLRRQAFHPISLRTSIRGALRLLRRTNRARRRSTSRTIRNGSRKRYNGKAPRATQSASKPSCDPRKRPTR